MSNKNDTDKAHPHIPVLLQSVQEFAHLRSGDVLVDGTVGFAGHAEALIPSLLPRGRFLGIDKDERSVEFSTKRLVAYGPAVQIVLGRVSSIKQIATDHGVQYANCILFDLGVSSLQLDDSQYGISFASSGDLDMRIGTGSGKLRAADVINKWSAAELKQLFTEHGQTGVNRLVARLLEERGKDPIRTVERLLAIIEETVPRVQGTHPATGVFQALRVVVNDEAGELASGLEQAIDLLCKGGRLLVISFHSGEDRMVKECFKRESRDCICPPEYPECRCSHLARLRIVTQKPIVPDAVELRQNPRSRSAKMRVAERI